MGNGNYTLHVYLVARLMFNATVIRLHEMDIMTASSMAGLFSFVPPCLYTKEIFEAECFSALRSQLLTPLLPTPYSLLFLP